MAFPKGMKAQYHGDGLRADFILIHPDGNWNEMVSPFIELNEGTGHRRSFSSQPESSKDLCWPRRNLRGCSAEEGRKPVSILLLPHPLGVQLGSPISQEQAPGVGLVAFSEVYVAVEDFVRPLSSPRHNAAIRRTDETLS